MHNVFLVDDDHFVRKGLLRLIDWEKCGFKVCAEADNGEDALGLIQEKKPDLVVTDIRMPVLDGLELIKSTVESTNLKPNFVIVSGYNDFKYAQQAMRYGVQDFILKPIDKDEFEKTLIRLADKLRTEKEWKINREKRVALTALEEILIGETNEENCTILQQKLNIANAEELKYIILEINNAIHEICNLKEKINQAIMSSLQEDMILTRDHGINSFGLLVSIRQLHSIKGNLEHFVTDLQEQLSTRLKTEISLFVGKTVKGPSGIKESFETANMVSQFKYTTERNDPIYFELVREQSVHYIELDHSLYKRLMDRIEENNLKAILSTIEEMFREFRKKMFARDAVKTSINRCVHELIKTIKQLDGDENQVSTLHTMLQWDKYPLTFKEIQTMFTEFVLDCAELIHLLHSDHANGNIYKVKKYIENHFQENITLKSLANEFYMNPVYMGQLFRKTYGIYYKDFILEVRMNEAKRLLRQTDMRVYQVAESVGFGNADYFVTQFEKYVGITPTQYRKKIHGKAL